jgi:dTDP-4-dehydrorhamnose reductase
MIIGNGKVAKVIRKKEDIVLSRNECDITDLDSVMGAISNFNGTVINCAAKTNLEWCQENKHETYCVNTVGAINLLKACQTSGAKLVHISSGCLFDGNKTISDEETLPTPAVWYTRTKTWADEFITSYGYENYLILRPRQLISAIAHPTNMLTKFARVEEFTGIEDLNSITCIEDFSDMIDHLLKIDARGIYNCANTGVISPYEIACKIRDVLNSNLKVTKISYDKLLKRLPNRRVNTILSTQKLERSGYIPRSAETALNWCLENYE